MCPTQICCCSCSLLPGSVSWPLCLAVTDISLWLGLRRSLWDLVLTIITWPVSPSPWGWTLWRSTAICNSFMLHSPSLQWQVPELVSLALTPHKIFPWLRIFHHQFHLEMARDSYQSGWCSKIFEATVKAYDSKKFYFFMAHIWPGFLLSSVVEK